MDAFCSNVGDDEGQKFRSLSFKRGCGGNQRVSSILRKVSENCHRVGALEEYFGANSSLH
jgi:hypothetical protein